jgi:hypothetical protein
VKRQLALAAILVCCSSAARSQTPDVSPDIASYPDPQCKKPRTTVVRPDVQLGGRQSAVDSGAVGAYNARVKAFNRDSAAYNSCMHAYIDAANRDVKTIQDKANADVKQITERANASMKVIQDKIRQAVADGNDLAAAMEKDTAKLRKQ